MKTRVKNLMMLSFLAGTVVMTSCKNSEENKEESAEPMQNEMHQESEMESTDHNSEEMEKYEDEELQAEFKDEATASLYSQYVAIKDALVNTDAETAKAEATELAENDNAEEIAPAAEKIAATDDVNTQREAFSELTKAMEVELEDALASGEIYKQFCPMAFEGQGDYWFANSKDVYNPYFGEKMLNCGRVDATIK